MNKRSKSNGEEAQSRKYDIPYDNNLPADIIEPRSSLQMSYLNPSVASTGMGEKIDARRRSLGQAESLDNRIASLISKRRWHGVLHELRQDPPHDILEAESLERTAEFAAYRARAAGEFTVAAELLSIAKAHRPRQDKQRLTSEIKRMTGLANLLLTPKPKIPAKKRTPEMKVIDAVRQGNLSRLRTILASEEVDARTCIELTSQVSDTMKYLIERKKDSMEIYLPDLEKRSQLSKCFLRYLVRDWIEDN